MQQRNRPRRGLMKVGLAVALLAIIAYGCVDLAPASPLPAGASPTVVAPQQSGPQQSGPQGTVDVTIGPSKTKKPKQTNTPPATTTTTSEPTTPTDTTTPTDVPTDMPTAAADTGLHLHSFVLASFVLASFVIQPPPKLDYQASANYGEANLSNGFSPDPYSVGTTSGGPVDVSYLGGSCSGFASSAPDLRVNFGGGGSSLLRIYYVGSNGDPAMVVNDPYGNFYCVDDSFGTVNPTIDFNNPAGGSYDIWIASYANNANVSGTLYMTENSGNHP